MAHIGFTPQHDHQLGGYRVQGLGEHAEHLIAMAKAFEVAGAFALLIEMVPGKVAAAITQAVTIPSRQPMRRPGAVRNCTNLTT